MNNTEASRNPNANQFTPPPETLCLTVAWFGASVDIAGEAGIGAEPTGADETKDE